MNEKRKRERPFSARASLRHLKAAKVSADESWLFAQELSLNPSEQDQARKQYIQAFEQYKALMHYQQPNAYNTLNQEQIKFYSDLYLTCANAYLYMALTFSTHRQYWADAKSFYQKTLLLCEFDAKILSSEERDKIQENMNECDVNLKNDLTSNTDSPSSFPSPSNLFFDSDFEEIFPIQEESDFVISNFESTTDSFMQLLQMNTQHQDGLYPYDIPAEIEAEEKIAITDQSSYSRISTALSMVEVFSTTPLQEDVRNERSADAKLGFQGPLSIIRFYPLQNPVSTCSNNGVESHEIESIRCDSH